MPMHTVPVFVYGTLRDGEGLHQLIEDSIVHRVAVANAYVDGDLYYHECGKYPVYLSNYSGGVVVGDLYEVTDDRDFRDTLMMELMAGYNAEWVNVYTADPTNPEVSALTFTWHGRTGAQIISGDWTKERNR